MNNQLPSKETVDRLRNQYQKGTRVELVSMDDPYSTLRPGDKGLVSFVDDIGTIFVRWDSGSGLGIAYGQDIIRPIENETKLSVAGQISEAKDSLAAPRKQKNGHSGKEPEL
jgi:hypothetical protein